jgi:hypothetical protein
MLLINIYSGASCFGAILVCINKINVSVRVEKNCIVFDVKQNARVVRESHKFLKAAYC